MTVTPLSGLSPRVRGNRGLLVSTADPRGSIPGDVPPNVEKCEIGIV